MGRLSAPGWSLTWGRRSCVHIVYAPDNWRAAGKASCLAMPNAGGPGPPETEITGPGAAARGGPGRRPGGALGGGATNSTRAWARAGESNDPLL